MFEWQRAVSLADSSAPKLSLDCGGLGGAATLPTVRGGRKEGVVPR